MTEEAKNSLLILAVFGILAIRKGRPAGAGGIGTIYSGVPEIFECNDGTFSSSSSSRGCVKHGGKKAGIR